MFILSEKLEKHIENAGFNFEIYGNTLELYLSLPDDDDNQFNIDLGDSLEEFKKNIFETWRWYDAEREAYNEYSDMVNCGFDEDCDSMLTTLNQAMNNRKDYLYDFYNCIENYQEV